MIPLQVHITSGPQAGTRLQLTQTPVSFGRSPENTLVLDVNTVSRNHGELRFEDDGQWWLVNLSQNGTRVGRKRVTKKPRALADGDAISIGDEEVFRAYYAGDTAAAGDGATDTEGDDNTQAQPASAAPGTGAGSRGKLWMFLGIWFALCIGLFVLFATTCDNTDPEGPAPQKVQRFETVDEVHKVLRREVERVTPDDHVYSVNVEQAREAYRTREPRYYYDAYHHYREAIRHLPAGQELPAEDRQRYETTLDELAELVHERFEFAVGLHSTRDHEQALREIDELRQYYRARPGDNELVDSILALRERVTQALN